MSGNGVDSLPQDGPLTHLWYGLRRIYIPTSPALLLQSQKALLDRFVKSVPVVLYLQFQLC